MDSTQEEHQRTMLPSEYFRYRTWERQRRSRWPKWKRARAAALLQHVERRWQTSSSPSCTSRASASGAKSSTERVKERKHDRFQISLPLRIDHLININKRDDKWRKYKENRTYFVTLWTKLTSSGVKQHTKSRLTGSNAAFLEVTRLVLRTSRAHKCMIFMKSYIKGLLLIKFLGRYEVWG